MIWRAASMAPACRQPADRRIGRFSGFPVFRIVRLAYTLALRRLVGGPARIGTANAPPLLSPEHGAILCRNRTLRAMFAKLVPICGIDRVFGGTTT